MPQPHDTTEFHTEVTERNHTNVAFWTMSEQWISMCCKPQLVLSAPVPSKKRLVSSRGPHKQERNKGSWSKFQHKEIHIQVKYARTRVPSATQRTKAHIHVIRASGINKMGPRRSWKRINRQAINSDFTQSIYLS